MNEENIRYNLTLWTKMWLDISSAKS